mmetsp:Transcript_32523/g.37424  ORF Transcript_32523/g.37424 Transcript_32523/m.37424 type:complete len:182 (+) Transcript_32523:157-702(+)
MSRCTGGKDFSANSNHSLSSTMNGNTRNDDRGRNDSSGHVASGHNMSRDMNNSNNTNNYVPTVTPCSQSLQSRHSRGKGFFIPPSLRTLPAESTTFPLFPSSSSYELDTNMSPFTRYSLIHPPHNTTAKQQHQQTNNNTARTFPDTSLSTTATASRTTTTTSQPYLCTKKFAANHLSKPAQ